MIMEASDQSGFTKAYTVSEQRLLLPRKCWMQFSCCFCIVYNNLFGPDTVDRLVLTDGGVVGTSTTTTRDSERNVSADMNESWQIKKFVHLISHRRYQGLLSDQYGRSF